MTYTKSRAAYPPMRVMRVPVNACNRAPKLCTIICCALHVYIYINIYIHYIQEDKNYQSLLERMFLSYVNMN